jgi:2-amino-4-hydroxy-6-hydroxymethyldihydropteridine diphosphokinase
MTDAIVGLGSNIGDRVAYLSRALGEMAELPESHLVAYSHAYESAPWGVEEQPEFLNAVAVLRTELRADQLLEALQGIEDELGRIRDVPNGPRTIDLDILLFGDEEWSTEILTIPHPRMAERDFVITPLLEVAPDATWPDGAPVTRDAVHVGAVLADVGPIPDPGIREGSPVAAEEWETVASGLTVPPDMSLGFKKLVLEQAGIPFAWDPYSPDEEFEPFGLAMPVRLKVPAELAARARLLISQAEEAPHIEEETSAEGAEDTRDTADVEDAEHTEDLEDVGGIW